MSTDPNGNETPAVVRPPIVLEDDTGTALAAGDRDLGADTVNAPTVAPGEELEPIRKPIVIEVEPETEEEEEGSRTPKNTNIETIEV